MQTIFDLCPPRKDVLDGRLRDEDFAADLSRVVNGSAPPEYHDSALFFAYSHPTRGLNALLESVCRRLSGTAGERCLAHAGKQGEVGARLGGLRADDERKYELEEDQAFVLALLFRALAPMRSLDRIRVVADGIERMSREGASYWLGTAVRRRNPRRALAALRLPVSAS